MARSGIRFWLPAFLAMFAVVVVGCSDDTGQDPPADTVGGEDTAEPPPDPIDWDEFYAPSDLWDDGKRRVTIVHTNDLHSHMDGLGPLADYMPDRLVGDGTRGGIARVAALVERTRRRARAGEAVIAVDAGDYSGGTAYSALTNSHGAELKVMDQMGFTGTTIGNHEFDWGVGKLAQSITTGLADAQHLHVLASNLVFDDEDPADDALAALAPELIKPWIVVELDNGLRVGLFGILGEGAYALAPSAPPVTVASPEEVAREMTRMLREDEGVDLVVCLSHSGVSETDIPGEDQRIARNVEGHDIIVSGHSHTLIAEPLEVGDTLIVQVGAYGDHVGRLTLVEEDGVLTLESYEAMPVDDTVPGEPAMLALIDTFEAALDAALFDELGVGYRDPVAVTSFDIPRVRFGEAPIGNLVADGVRWSAAGVAPAGVDVAIEANGVLRSGIRAGQSGKILMGDLIRVVPLGKGPDGELGYPILVVYLTAAELKTTMEIIAGLAEAVSDSFYLQISGLRFEYNPRLGLVNRVQAVYLGNAVDGYDDTPIDTSAANTRLYAVATNLYIGEMLGVLQTMLPALRLIPKDAQGNPIEDLRTALVDIAPAEPGVTELKLWRTLYEALASFPVDPDVGLPRVPDLYDGPEGRILAVE